MGWTPATADDYDGLLLDRLDLLEEFWTALWERVLLEGDFPYDGEGEALAFGGSPWGVFQAAAAGSVTGFLRTATDEGAPIIYTVSNLDTAAVWTWEGICKAAGMWRDATHYGWRRVPGLVPPANWKSVADGAFEFGEAQAGDMLGPWIPADLRRVLSLLTMTLGSITTWDGSYISTNAASDEAHAPSETVTEQECFDNAVAYLTAAWSEATPDLFTADSPLPASWFVGTRDPGSYYNYVRQEVTGLAVRARGVLTATILGATPRRAATATAYIGTGLYGYDWPDYYDAQGLGYVEGAFQVLEAFAVEVGNEGPYYSAYMGTLDQPTALSIIPDATIYTRSQGYKAGKRTVQASFTVAVAAGTPIETADSTGNGVSIAISGSPGHGATATATVTNGKLASVAVDEGGHDYPGDASATPSAGGGTLSVTVTDGVVTAISVDAEGDEVSNHGSGFTRTGTFVDITDATGQGAVGYANVTAGAVSSVTMISGGWNYSAGATATVRSHGSVGSGAVLSCNVSGGEITSISVTSGGSNYVQNASATIGGDGSGAKAVVTADGGVSVIVTNGGEYTAAPTAEISDSGDGTGATASCALGEAVLEWVYDEETETWSWEPKLDGEGNPLYRVTVTVTNAGHDYTSPSIAFNGGTGSGLAATIDLAGCLLSLIAHGKGYTAPAYISITGGNGDAYGWAYPYAGKHLASVTVVDGGSGFTTANAIPTIRPYGTIPDFGAPLLATVDANGTITAITVDPDNAGYDFVDGSEAFVSRELGGTIPAVPVLFAWAFQYT